MARASALQAEGQRFDSVILHRIKGCGGVSATGRNGKSTMTRLEAVESGTERKLRSADHEREDINS